MIRPFSNDGCPMWFSTMIILDGIIGDRVGQLGENGEYWMGRLRVVWIVFRPPTVCPSRHTHGRRHLGEVGSGPAFWSSHEWLPLVVPTGLRLSCCQVYTLARLTIDSNLCDTLGQG
jgi:hypothetical protein